MSGHAGSAALAADLAAAVAAAVGPVSPVDAGAGAGAGPSAVLDTAAGAGDGPGAVAAADVIVEEEATLEAVRAKGLLSCARCGLRLEHGQHVPRLLPACLHTLCSLCVPPTGNGKQLAEVNADQTGEGGGGGCQIDAIVGDERANVRDVCLLWY